MNEWKVSKSGVWCIIQYFPVIISHLTHLTWYIADEGTGERAVLVFLFDHQAILRQARLPLVQWSGRPYLRRKYCRPGWHGLIRHNRNVSKNLMFAKMPRNKWLWQTLTSTVSHGEEHSTVGSGPLKSNLRVSSHTTSAPCRHGPPTTPPHTTWNTLRKS